MKKTHLIAIGLFIVITHSSLSLTRTVVDLNKVVKDKGIEVYNRELSMFKDGSRAAIRLSKAEGEGVAWIKGVEFSSGTLEFDVRGENIKQHSFVGIAFHWKDNNTFDAIYMLAVVGVLHQQLGIYFFACRLLIIYQLPITAPCLLSNTCP
jgi:hypothetical protein